MPALILIETSNFLPSISACLSNGQQHGSICRTLLALVTFSLACFHHFHFLWTDLLSWTAIQRNLKKSGQSTIGWQEVQLGPNWLGVYGQGSEVSVYPADIWAKTHWFSSKEFLAPKSFNIIACQRQGMTDLSPRLVCAIQTTNVNLIPICTKSCSLSKTQQMNHICWGEWGCPPLHRWSWKQINAHPSLSFFLPSLWIN